MSHHRTDNQAGNPNTTGYYSLVQYCPDPMRLESKTLGVILFSPDRDLLDVRTASSLQRVKRFFASDTIDTKWLRFMLDNLTNRLVTEKQYLRTLKDFERFVELRSGELLLTPPRYTKVTEPRHDLDALCQRILGEDYRKEMTPETRKPQLPAKLAKALEEAVKSNRAERNVAVPLPLGEKLFQAPYAYQNGTRNLVKPVSFSSSRSKAIDQTEKLAIESDMIRKVQGPGGVQQKVLLIVPPRSELTKLPWADMRRFLEDYGARVAQEREVDELLVEVSSAH